MLLGDVQAEPAEVGAASSQNVGQRLGRRLEQGAGGAAGVALGEEVGGGVGEGAVVFGDGDRHGERVPSILARVMRSALLGRHRGGTVEQQHLLLEGGAERAGPIPQ